MTLISLLPLAEMLICNSIACDRCCHRKFSLGKTFLILVLFTCAFVLCVIPFVRQLFHGDGRFALVGFFYLIPLNYVYRENRLLLFVIMCTCWAYTLGLFTLALQINNILLPSSYILLTILYNLLLLGTLYPFFKWIVPMHVFILKNIQSFEKHWYRYLSLSSCLNFSLLLLLNNIFLGNPGSFVKVMAIVLLMASTYLSYFILYRIVLDAIRMNRLEYAAFHDSLTGLGNRAHLWNDLNMLLDSNETFSVLFMDLDHLKTVNDQYGHLTGDAYLKHFAQISSEIFQNRGEIYRFGGDEFAAIYYGIPPQSILQELRECRGWENGAPCPFRQVSVGILHCRPPHQDAEQILRQVDRLMYEKKIERRMGVEHSVAL